jgi:phosphohistidine swiveling domain-containing protein
MSDDLRFEIVERLYNAPWMLVGYSSVGFVHDLPAVGAGNLVKDYVGTMDSSSGTHTVNEMLFVPEQFEAAAAYGAQRIIDDRKWREQCTREFTAYAQRYFAAGDRLRVTSLGELSGRELWEAAREAIGLQKHVRVLGIVLNGVILDGKNHLSDRIRMALRSEIGDEVFDKRWSLLTQVSAKRSMRQEKIHVLRALAKKGGASPEELRDVHERFCWLEYMYLGPASTIAQLERELASALDGEDPDAHMAATRAEQQTLMDGIGMSARARELVALAQEILWQKGWRKDVEYHGCWCYEQLLRELARRHGEDDWRTIAFLLPWELESFILNGMPSVRELRERRAFSCIVVDREGHRMLVGDEARSLRSKLPLAHVSGAAAEVKGQVAYAGKARGRVKIIHVPAEMAKMERGDILISQATSPDLVDAMRKAAAIVTNTGGLICHAAITARELRIPCVVGTRKATEVFSDGDLVEVDAEKGIVRKL